VKLESINASFLTLEQWLSIVKTVSRKGAKKDAEAPPFLCIFASFFAPLREI